MRALVYHGPGQTSWEPVTDPAIEDPTDVIVRVDATTICGADLCIRHGYLPEVKPGTVLGHEAVGEAMNVGHEVHSITRGGPGDCVGRLGVRALWPRTSTT